MAGGATFCGNGLHPVAKLTHGTWFLEPDIDHCNYLILDGTQSGFVANHLPMDLAERMRRARERGMKLVVMDPIETNAGKSADEWIGIVPGTDGELALALANVLVNELGIYDAEFLEDDTRTDTLIGTDSQVRDGASGKPQVWDTVRGAAGAFDAVGWESQALVSEYTVDGRACMPAFRKVKEHLAGYAPEAAARICGCRRRRSGGLRGSSARRRRSVRRSRWTGRSAAAAGVRELVSGADCARARVSDGIFAAVAKHDRGRDGCARRAPGCEPGGAMVGARSERGRAAGADDTYAGERGQQPVSGACADDAGEHLRVGAVSGGPVFGVDAL